MIASYFLVITVPKVSLGDRCFYGDVCTDVNAQCRGTPGFCQCNGDFIVTSNQCGEWLVFSDLKIWYIMWLQNWARIKDIIYFFDCAEWISWQSMSSVIQTFSQRNFERHFYM